MHDAQAHAGVLMAGKREAQAIIRDREGKAVFDRFQTNAHVLSFAMFGRISNGFLHNII